MSTFFEIALSNVVISLGLAIFAFVLGFVVKRPRLMYLFWLIVLVKLVTPSLVTVPVAAFPGQVEITNLSQLEEGAPAIVDDGGLIPASTPWYALSSNATETLAVLWLLGSMIIIVVSLTRVYRFNRLLRKESIAGSPELQVTAARIASCLNLKAVPTIYTTSARLTPMVWWVGGKVRIVVPASLLEQMDSRQFQWVLAHELAHVSRRDYLARWVEWLACVCFWWNPVVYWGRHNLRRNEELCCDALVVSCLSPNPHIYADSLLNAFESLVYPAIRPPAMASEINGGDFLERRFKMIVSGTLTRKTSRWTLAGILVCAVAVLSLGLGCQEDETSLDSAPINGQSIAAGEPTESADREVSDAEHNAEIKEDVSVRPEGEDLPTVDEFVPVEQIAEMVHYVQPEYPLDAQRAGIEGVVWVKALIGKKGDVLDAVVFKTSETASLDESAVKAARGNKFKPAMQQGRPVAMWVTYKVNFAI